MKKLSKFLSFVLRHHPEAIGLELDPYGWAFIPDLIEKAKDQGRLLDRENLKDIVESGSKKRFAISGDGNHIRAGYGHSIDVDLALKPVTPPHLLYHGTARKNLNSIRKDGLHAGSRLYVHLSSGRENALAVGQRHGKPVVLNVEAKRMYEAGFPFYQSESEPDIWLTEKVPQTFIHIP